MIPGAHAGSESTGPLKGLDPKHPNRPGKPINFGSFRLLGSEKPVASFLEKTTSRKTTHHFFMVLVSFYQVIHRGLLDQVGRLGPRNEPVIAGKIEEERLQPSGGTISIFWPEVRHLVRRHNTRPGRRAKATGKKHKTVTSGWSFAPMVWNNFNS